jgi:hypothetical protein
VELARSGRAPDDGAAAAKRLSSAANDRHAGRAGDIGGVPDDDAERPEIRRLAHPNRSGPGVFVRTLDGVPPRLHRSDFVTPFMLQIVQMKVPQSAQG